LNSTGRIRRLTFSVDKPLHESIEAYADSCRVDAYKLMCDAFVTNLRQLELEPLAKIGDEDPYAIEMYLVYIDITVKRYRWGLKCSEQMLSHIDQICADQRIGIIGLFRQSVTRYSARIIMTASFTDGSSDHS
jgi:hypothetical protein